MTITHILLALILVALVIPGVLRWCLLTIASLIDLMLLPIKLPMAATQLTLGGALRPLMKHRVLGLVVVVSVGAAALWLMSHIKN